MENLAKRAPADAKTYRVVLFEADEGGTETAYEAADAADALRWAAEWMREPLGLSVAIVPPRG